MLLAHKIELKPTKDQITYLTKACAVDRFTYNWALTRYKEQLALYKASKDVKDRPNINQLKKEFNLIKKEQFAWVMEVTKCAAEQPFANLKTAFSKFFKQLSKFPAYHRRDKKQSFYLSNDKFSIKNKSVRVPRLGAVKLTETLKFSGKIMSGVISSKGGRWFISIAVDISDYPEQLSDFYKNKLANNLKLKDDIKVVDYQVGKSEAVGVDLGIKTAIFTSDREQILAPKPLKKYLQKLKRTQRNLNRKMKDSKNRSKAKDKLAKLHFRITNIRKDWLHKVTKYLCVNYKTIAIEDLNVKGMIKNHKLSKAINDIGFGMFRIFLEYKSKFTMSTLKVINRFAPSSKTCSGCGYKNTELTLKDRYFDCKECNLHLDRDYNASINILRFSTQGY